MQSEPDHPPGPVPSVPTQAEELATFVRTLDPTGGGLASIRNFGEEAIKAVMLGLSRPFNTTAEDCSALIKEWELRDTSCCYQGSVEDLCSLKGTVVLAVSYKHDEEGNWRRKGQRYVSKFSPPDERLFTAAVEAFAPTYKTMMVWCDRILATRPEVEETRVEWYHVGLLPYMTFPVLNLSAHIPQHVLDNRLWIKAERSLGSMAYGFFNANDLARGIRVLKTGQGLPGLNCMKTMARQILSEYWPEDLGCWQDDYHRMKEWALGVTCRADRGYFNIPLFQKHNRIDNHEILSNMGELSLILGGMEGEPPFFFTQDKQFFLKATAFNLSVENVWEKNPRYVSHFMGLLEDTKFSWWKANNSKILFGCITCGSQATTVLALEADDGYKMVRNIGDYLLYSHADTAPGENTKRQILQAAERATVHLDADLKWNLLYCSDNCGYSDFDTPVELFSSQGQPATAEIFIAPIFRGSTSRLFNCLAALHQDNLSEVASKFCKCLREWNEYVESTYDNWVTVRDSMSPVWIWMEGFTEECMTFGFLEYLTKSLLINESGFSENMVRMADPNDVMAEINAARTKMQDDQRCLVEEFFGNDERNESLDLSKRDVVRYTIGGGFTNKFFPQGFQGFLDGTARSRLYWHTMIVCRNGVMQIRFTNAAYGKRIAQRRTTLENYSGNGLVHPDDNEQVLKISIGYDCSDPWHTAMIYWNEMEDTTSHAEMWRLLGNSKRVYRGREVLLADMTIGDSEECRLLGHANNFRAGRDPFQIMEMIKSGQAEAYMADWWEREARERARVEPRITTIRENIDRFGERQRQSREQENENQGQSSSEGGN